MPWHGRSVASVGWGGMALLTGTLMGCGPTSVDEDGRATGACRREVQARAPGSDLRSTVRDQGRNGWHVNVWVDKVARGTPDYSCEVVRDARAEAGYRVVQVRPS